MGSIEQIETSDRFLGFSDEQLAAYIDVPTEQVDILRANPFSLNQLQIERLEILDEMARIFMRMTYPGSVLLVMHERPVKRLGGKTYIDFMTNPSNDPIDALNCIRIGTGYSDISHEGWESLQRIQHEADSSV